MLPKELSEGIFNYNSKKIYGDYVHTFAHCDLVWIVLPFLFYGKSDAMQRFYGPNIVKVLSAL